MSPLDHEDAIPVANGDAAAGAPDAMMNGGAVPTPPATPGRSSRASGDDESSTSGISHLTEASLLSRTSASVSSVLQQSLQILRGELPEEDRAAEDDDRPQPFKSISFGAIPREFSNEEDEEDDDAKSEVSIDFLEDPKSEMTYARRIALSLMDKKWYNPRADDEQAAKEGEATGRTELNGDSTRVNGETEVNGQGTPPPQVDDENKPGYVTQVQHPSLARAWAYFEHVTLPRYVLEEPTENKPKKNIVYRAYRKLFRKGGKQLDRAEPGENHFPTRLYDPIFTPLAQMGDFGLGIGLYFSTLRAITILTLLAGLLNIPNFMYYSGPDYSDSQEGVPSLLKGSSICTNQVWVPCPNCTEDQFADDRDRLASVDIVETNSTLTFALHNDCDGATLQQGMINYGTLLLVLFGIVVMNHYQRYMEVKYDEDEQTAQDYSMLISNPPPDATDPDEWKTWFHETFDGAHTTAVTIAVDNDFLVRSLLERRECMRKIEMLLEPGTPTDLLNLARIAAQMERERSFFARVLAMVAPGVPELFGRATVLTSRVQGLAQQDYPVKHVFVSFETEAAQRRVLSALSVGSLAASRNNVKVMADTPQYLFRGQHLLLVKEPDEPSTVRWQDLNAKLPARMKALLMTTLATIAAIVLIALLIRVLHGVDAAWSALAIAASNSIFPEFAKLLTLAESHASEGGKQTSLYFKIAVFRWVNTAIIITIITPFTATIDNVDGLIRSIYAIFFAEIVTTNAIQLLDPGGHFKRHFLAPRASTQDAMNLAMMGQVIELAERYTNMTKILFLALWYCAIYPGALFMCSFALFINFFTDRFSLMRTWKRAPALGTRISRFSRRYFFSTAIVAMAVVSSYFWAGFPFDNLCPNDEVVDSSYFGTWTATTAGGETRSVTLNENNETMTYRYCLQDLLRTSGQSFPAVPQFQPEGNEWMTSEQEQVTTVYGWTSVAVVALVIASFIWGWYQKFRGLFRSTYSPNGEDQGINFSEVPSISTYVPQVLSNVFSYPLFACNIDGIDDDLFDWTDPDHPHSYYDLTKDADVLLSGMDMSHKQVFSTLRHYPPPKEKRSVKQSK